jgi:hypothetical protein
MKIKNQLFLFLFPVTIGCIILVASMLSYHWHKKTIEDVESRLKASVVSLSLLIDIDDIKPSFSLDNALKESIGEISDNLEIKNLYFLTKSNFSNISTTKSPYKITNIINHKSSHLPFTSFPKKAFTTISKEHNKISEKILSAYSPIFDKNSNKIVAFIGADISLKNINKQFNKTLLITLSITLLIIIFISSNIYYIGNKISIPIQKLSSSALAIAAGQYGNVIEIKGPSEITELSNTLNTMSECLEDNINRLQQQAYLKEKLYGKHESALLLQNYMLKKTIDENKSDFIALKEISFFSSEVRGLLLDFAKETDSILSLHVVQSEEKEFEGMYSLLTDYKLYKEGKTFEENKAFLSLQFEKFSHKLSINPNSINFFKCLIWSNNDIHILSKDNLLTTILPGDLLFICNQGLENIFDTKEQLKSLFKKVLKVFSEEGLEVCLTMLKKEISFILQKQLFKEDIHIICGQILY